MAVDSSGNVYALQGAGDAGGLGGATYARPGAGGISTALNAQRTQAALAQRQAAQVCAKPQQAQCAL